ncbi:MAG: DUF1566 domain-containing protein [Thermodesulfobacteriota bacterium]|nr:DUF1566 domain-containing protein [Thermodesulfobacteriota bacterium]
MKDASWGGQYAFWVDTMEVTNAGDRAGQLENGVGGFSDGSVEGDWRLSTKTELYGLANGMEAVGASSMRAFSGVQSYYYWSSTTYEFNPGSAWYLGVSNGYVGDGNKGGGSYVWPVRSGN